MIEIRSILCPVDFSDLSRHALAHAIAKWYEARLTALYVVNPVTSYTPGTRNGSAKRPSLSVIARLAP